MRTWLLLPSRTKTKGEGTERSSLTRQKEEGKRHCLWKTSCQRKNLKASQSISLGLQQPKGRNPPVGNRGRNNYHFVVLLFFLSSLIPIISCVEKAKFTVLTQDMGCIQVHNYS